MSMVLFIKATFPYLKEKLENCCIWRYIYAWIWLLKPFWLLDGLAAAVVWYTYWVECCSSIQIYLVKNSYKTLLFDMYLLDENADDDTKFWTLVFVNFFFFYCTLFQFSSLFVGGWVGGGFAYFFMSVTLSLLILYQLC